MSLIDRVKEHWIGGVIAVTAISVGATWTVLNEVSLKPRDFVIEQQKATIASLTDKLRDADRQERQSALVAAPSSIILQPTWVYDDLPLLALDNQVSIRLSSASSRSHFASFDVQIPEQDAIHLGFVGLGNRQTFSYKGITYLFDVLDVSDRGAKVTIARKL